MMSSSPDASDCARVEFWPMVTKTTSSTFGPSPQYSELASRRMISFASSRLLSWNGPVPTGFELSSVPYSSMAARECTDAANIARLRRNGAYDWVS